MLRTMTKALKDHPTLSLAAACALLVLGFVVTIANTKSNEPTTLDGVTAEVTTGIDVLEDQMPRAARVNSSDEMSLAACPDGRPGQQSSITRTIEVAHAFDSREWISNLAAKYDALDGWTARVKALGSRDHVELTIVGRPLLIYTITTGSPLAPQQVFIRSTSRCSVG